VVVGIRELLGELPGDAGMLEVCIQALLELAVEPGSGGEPVEVREAVLELRDLVEREALEVDDEVSGLAVGAGRLKCPASEVSLVPPPDLAEHRVMRADPHLTVEGDDGVAEAWAASAALATLDHGCAPHRRL